MDATATSLRTTTLTPTAAISSSKSEDATMTPINSNSNSVQVAVRVRPLSTAEAALTTDCCVHTLGATRVVLNGDKQFDFDAAFAPDAPQQRVYEQLIAPLVDRFFDGYNATVLAYGQTGSGKTFTMGNEFRLDANPLDRGIIPRALAAIFDRVDASPRTTRCVVTVSYLEILNEEIYDLLARPSSASTTSSTSSTNGLAIRDDGTRNGVLVSGLYEPVVTSLAQVATLLQTGAAQRATAATTMNAHSSRSHAICTLTLTQTDATTRSVAKFSLVDLAGSERVKRTQALGARFKEGVSINKSLLALGNVINALCAKQQPSRVANGSRSATSGVATPAPPASSHVKYRDSKLTRLLAHALGGNSKTLMIACVSPAPTNRDETISTLRYAARARSITNVAVVNRDIRAATAEVAALKAQVAALQLQQNNGQPSDAERQQQADELQALRCVNDAWQRVAREALDVDAAVETAHPLPPALLALARDALALADAIPASPDSIDKHATSHALNVPSLSSSHSQLQADVASLSDVIRANETILRGLAALPATTTTAHEHLQTLTTTYAATIDGMERRIAAAGSEPIDAALAHELTAAQQALAATRRLIVALESTDDAALTIAALERELIELKRQRTALQRRLRLESDARRREARAQAFEIVQLKRHDEKTQLELQRLAARHAKQHNVLKRKTEEVARVHKRLRTMATPQAKVRRSSSAAGETMTTPLTASNSSSDDSSSSDDALVTRVLTQTLKAHVSQRLRSPDTVDAVVSDDALPVDLLPASVSACHSIIRLLVATAVDAQVTNAQRDQTIETLQQQLAAAQAQTKKPVKKRNVAATDYTDEIVSSSTSDADHDSDDDDSDYVEQTATQRRQLASTSNRPRASLAAVLTSRVSSDDPLDEIDALLATRCCTCSGKCATRACVCKDALQLCSVACACNVVRCRNRHYTSDLLNGSQQRPEDDEDDRDGGDGDNERREQDEPEQPAQQPQDDNASSGRSGSGTTMDVASLPSTSSSFAFASAAAADKENIVPMIPYVEVKQFWAARCEKMNSSNNNVIQRTPLTPSRSYEPSDKTPKSLIKPPSRRFVLQSITKATALRRNAGLTASSSRSNNVVVSTSSSSSSSADRIARFL